MIGWVEDGVSRAATLLALRDGAPNPADALLGALLEVALPDSQDLPSLRTEFTSLASVSPAVPLDLLLPELSVLFRGDVALARVVPVPEAPVHEHSDLGLGPCEVGRAGEGQMPPPA